LPDDSGVPSRGRTLAVCILLLLAVGLVFSQGVGFSFVSLDDPAYVWKNPFVSPGLTMQGIVAAFTRSPASNWIPLTWLSLMLDTQLYGLQPGGYHVTNALLHAGAVMFLFLVFRQMTRRFWPSAVVAALFAVHPLRAESVAWITERKDVLSGLFFTLTLAAYVEYVRRGPSAARYLLVMVFFALGLMAKATLVTLPAVLFLLDYWPLARFARQAPGVGGGHLSSPWRLVVEKLPLFLLAAACCLVTLWTQNAHLRPGTRLANVSVYYASYVAQLFWPVNLAIHPKPEGCLPAWQIVGATAVLACLTLGALAYRRRCPYLLVGWLWYVGMLMPVSGIAQVGFEATADRFTYLPHIGLYVALAWAAADARQFWGRRRAVWALASSVVLAILMGGAWRQASFWRDSESLWTHALQCDSRNSVAYSSMGSALEGRMRFAEAARQYHAVLKFQPDNRDVLMKLAWLRATCPDPALRNSGEAIALAQQANKVSGGEDPDALDVLAAAYAEAGRFTDALATARKALALFLQPHETISVGPLRARIALFAAGRPYHRLGPGSPEPP
jgi:tetratricopeptide (TPR) repeat protein